MASAIRDAPPVKATMPSALRSSGTSSAGTSRMNQTKPSPTNNSSETQNANVNQPRRRSNGGDVDRPAARGASAAPSPVLDSTVGISSAPFGMIAQNSASTKRQLHRPNQSFGSCA